VLSDCKSGVCSQGVCEAPDCQDRVRNGDETDVDCGGPDCSGCATGENCSKDSDCRSSSCKAGICQPSCTDNVQNGGETDVDCGGPDCQPCSPGSNCSKNSDCKKTKCQNGTCKPTCSDGFENGSESDVDCGGSCSGCDVGQSCNQDSDCKDGIACVSGQCQGYGSGAEGAVTISNDTTLDPVRATASGSSGSKTLSYSDLTGSFANGDRVVVHQTQSDSEPRGATSTPGSRPWPAAN